MENGIVRRIGSCDAESAATGAVQQQLDKQCCCDLVGGMLLFACFLASLAVGLAWSCSLHGGGNGAAPLPWPAEQLHDRRDCTALAHD